MGKRIKFVGFIDVEELDPDQVDLDHSSGLSAAGYDDLVVGGEAGAGLLIGQLDDVSTEVVDE